MDATRDDSAAAPLGEGDATAAQTMDAQVDHRPADDQVAPGSDHVAALRVRVADLVAHLTGRRGGAGGDDGTPGEAAGGERGQGLIEFTLVTPFIFALFMGVLEFSLALGASLGVSRASQEGAHVAAAAGNIAGADCLILRKVEQDITAPSDPSHIIEVDVARTALAGDTMYGQQVWRRTGSTECLGPDGSTLTVPYTLIESGYPEEQRCTVLSGCPLLTPARPTVDNIGVTVRYRHDWVTPLQGAMGLIGGGSEGEGGWTFEQRSIFRMEPTL